MKWAEAYAIRGENKKYLENLKKIKSGRKRRII